MPAIDAITWLNQHAHEYTSALQLVPVEVDGALSDEPIDLWPDGAPALLPENDDVITAEIHEADCGPGLCTCGASVSAAGVVTPAPFPAGAQ